MVINIRMNDTRTVTLETEATHTGSAFELIIRNPSITCVLVTNKGAVRTEKKVSCGHGCALISAGPFHQLKDGLGTE